MVIEGDDKILAVGMGPYTNSGGYDQNFWVTRVLADGSAADASFGTNGAAEAAFGVHAVPTAVALDPTGKIVVTGPDEGSLPFFRTARFLGDAPPPAIAARVAPNPAPVQAPATGITWTPSQDLVALALDSSDLLTVMRSKHRHAS
jgi:hypothetical protein